MRISIGGYSFHRLIEGRQQTIFQYISDCKALGCTQLDPWNAQLAPIRGGDEVAKAGSDPGHARLSAQDDAYVREVRQAADEASMPFGCIAVDGAHIYEPDPEARAANRRLAYRWLDVAHILGAEQVRIDAGGPEEMPDDVLGIIVEGYTDLISRGRDLSIEILFENHWGPSIVPDNVLRLLDAVDGLGFLFDSNNWKEGRQREGWERCARYAHSTHFKTYSFDEDGNDPSVDIPACVRILADSGYQGCWGVESVPEDGDEYGAVKKTIKLIRRTLGQ